VVILLVVYGFTLTVVPRFDGRLFLSRLETNELYRPFQEELRNCIRSVTGWRLLRKRLRLKAFKLSTVQSVERWIVSVSMPLHANVFVTLATQYHLEYRCKSLFETPCIPVKVTLNRNYPR
jgi:hypothetical protein